MLISLPRAVALLFLAALILCAELARAQTAPAPSASPAPSPAPTPNIAVSGYATFYTFNTSNVNASGALDTGTGVDKSSRTDYSNLQVTMTRNTGVFRFGFSAGGYSFPTVGQALNPSFERGANDDLYGWVPSAYVQLVPSGSWTFSAGSLGALLGQESAFTWQNVNVQRGLAFAIEPTFSRGARTAYAQGKFTGILEYNDGYWSGQWNTFEGLVGWAPSANTNLQFAWIVPPTSQVPNRTAGIANKREYDFMLTQTFGKLTLTPYALWVNSPSSSMLGYTKAETAFAGSLIGSWAFDGVWSLGGRYESVANRSAAADTSGNADMIGYGAGSKATTWTITPAYKNNHIYVRGEYSNVRLGVYLSGLGFGTSGTLNSQSRLGLEFGAYF